MQEIELVDIEDVYPYQQGEEKMNPRDFSTEESREYIAQLAEQFKYNKLNHGQPRMKPILYRDGGIYQIIDGECRVRAMKSIGTKRFLAEVYDDIADAETARAEAAKAMVETDAKLRLTPQEMSRGVQTMLALDLPDEEVAAVARIDAGSVRRARSAAKAVSDAAYDMTIDRLLAIADFEGDGEAVAKLRDCPEKDWRRVYESLLAERDRKAAEAEMAGMLGAAGVPMADAAPDGHRVGRTFSPNRSGVKWLADTLEQGVPDGSVAVGSPFGIMLYSPAAEGESVSREDQEEAEARSALEAELDTAEAARNSWVAERIADIGRMRATARLLHSWARSCSAASNFERSCGWVPPCQPTALTAAIGYGSRCRIGSWSASRAVLEGDTDYLSTEAASKFVDLMAAMESDGYEPSGAEKRLAAVCESALEVEANE